jgi:hypothetical protein
MMKCSLLLSLALVGPVAAQDRAPDLAAPIALQAGGVEIDVDGGHAAPFVHDVDGDGKRDLLVGQFDDGALRLYRSEGDGRLAASTWMQVAGAKASTEFG